jgi:amidohydrolase
MSAEPAPADGPPAVPRALDHWLDEHGEGLIAIRRNIHAHPELSGEEHATTELVLERLQLAGLEPRTLTSGTGLICDLRPEGVTGPALALRADLDALAMADEKDVQYRSQVDGVSHACGHDVHTAIVLGTALYFAHHRDELRGPLRFLFQPAEERVPGGALDVLADSGLDGVGAIVGIHCEPKLDAGRIGVRTGAISSAADMARILLSGPGGHTARPELTVDLVAVAAQVVTELPLRVKAHLGDPSEVKVVFGALHAGDAANVIPTHCELRASIRTPSLAVWEELPGIVSQALAEVLEGSPAEHRLEYTHGVPPVVNDARVTGIVRAAAQREFGIGAVTEAEQSWGGDDFAWFSREVPGTYVRLGVHDPRGDVPWLDLHAGHFDVDERAIALGVRLLVASVIEYFASSDQVTGSSAPSSSQSAST